jgi:hypothetical protein
MTEDVFGHDKFKKWRLPECAKNQAVDNEGYWLIEVSGAAKTKETAIAIFEAAVKHLQSEPRYQEGFQCGGGHTITVNAPRPNRLSDAEIRWFRNVRKDPLWVHLHPKEAGEPK